MNKIKLLIGLLLVQSFGTALGISFGINRDTVGYLKNILYIDRFELESLTKGGGNYNISPLFFARSAIHTPFDLTCKYDELTNSDFIKTLVENFTKNTGYTGPYKYSLFYDKVKKFKNERLLDRYIALEGRNIQDRLFYDLGTFERLLKINIDSLKAHSDFKEEQARIKEKKACRWFRSAALGGAFTAVVAGVATGLCRTM